MKPGFIAVDRERYYLNIWPRVGHCVEVINSNLKAVTERRETVLHVEWGRLDAGPADVLIITESDGSRSGNDCQWVAQALLDELAR